MHVVHKVHIVHILVEVGDGCVGVGVGVVDVV